MQNLDSAELGTIEREVYVDAAPEVVYEVVSRPEHIAHWFPDEAAYEPVPGATGTIAFQMPDGRVVETIAIVEAQPPRRLVIRWRHKNRPELEAEGDSLCTMELEPNGSAVKLSITHAIDRVPSKLIEAVSGGWPKILSNLKSLLETGSIALLEPYPKAGDRPMAKQP